MYENLKTTLGFTDYMTNIQKARVEKLLYKLITDKYYSKGIVYTQVGYLLNSLIDGRTVDKEENVTYYKRNGELTKPKTVYRLYYKPEEGESESNIYTPLKKTEYDFCMYCILHGLTTQEAIEQRIKYEQEQKEEIKRQEKIKEEERKRQVEKEAKEKELVHQKLKDTLENLSSIEKALMSNVFLLIHGEESHNYNLLALIHNYDNDYCKNEIVKLLHNYNKASIKVFECFTGLTLPKSCKERAEFLLNLTPDNMDIDENRMRNVVGNIQKKIQRKYKVFYELCTFEGKKSWIKVLGEPININGHDCFIRKTDNYRVSLAKCGLLISYDNSKSEAIEKAEKIIKSMSDETFKSVDDMINTKIIPTIGQNPLYRTTA